jgi:electron transfer flavoprotein alpha subunit
MAEDVLVLITDTAGESLSAGGLEALGFGRRLADALGGRLVAALLAPAGSGTARDAAERGAERVLVLDGEGSAPAGELLLALAVEASRAIQPKVVVVSRGPHALQVAPGLAARLGGGCVMNVTEATVSDGGVEAAAAIFGGAARAVYRVNALPAVLAPAAGAAEAPPRGDAGSIESLALAQPRSRVRTIRPPRMPEGPRLEDAPIVVSGGRGLGDRENYALIRELAAALGGMPGASRAIVDDGWAQPAEQVGLTGKIVTPRLYLAVGISGASQHMAGCSNAATLVAINADAGAPIFRFAQLGIVDDCLAVLPELIRIAKQRATHG